MSDHLILAPERLHRQIAKLFIAMLIHGHQRDDLRDDELLTHQLQFDFKENHGTTPCTLILSYNTILTSEL